MSMTLYHGEPNGPSLTVLAALFEKDVAAELVRIDLGGGERHDLAHSAELDMSIEGEGPVLMVDGEAMTDSVFIACYLDDIGTGPKLRPQDAYARWEVMMWCRQIIERLAPAAAYLGCQAHLHPRLRMMRDDVFAPLVARIASVDLRIRWQEVRGGVFAEERLTDCRSKVVQAVAKCEARLPGRDWLMGDFSLADLETYAWLVGMASLVPEAFADAPLTGDWMHRVAARPSVARALGLATVPEPQNLWSLGPEINRWG